MGDARDLLRDRENAISKGAPITARSTRLTFDDAVKDVQADYDDNGKRSKGELTRRIKLRVLHAYSAGGGFSRSPRRTFARSPRPGSRPRRRRRNQPRTRDRPARVPARPSRPNYHGRSRKRRCCRNGTRGPGSSMMRCSRPSRAKLPAALQPVVTFAYVTGWRVQSEILPLEWRHVDRKAREARLEPGTTKNQAGRSFRSPTRSATLVEARWRPHEALEKAGTICRYVFHRNGRRIKGVQKAWANACKAGDSLAGFPHDLGAPRSEHGAARAYRVPSRGSLQATRPRVSIGGMPLLARATLALDLRSWGSSFPTETDSARQAE